MRAESLKLLLDTSLKPPKAKFQKIQAYQRTGNAAQPFWVPREFQVTWKQIKPEITLHKTPLIHLKASGRGLHIPDSQALQAPGMLKILHFASIYKAYLEAIDHFQKPKLSASLICSLSLSSWKTLCAHLTILQARSGYSSHLKKGDSVPWPQWKHLKEQGWMSASPNSTPWAQLQHPTHRGA